MELSADYKQEQTALKARIAEIQAEQGRAREAAANVERFITEFYDYLYLTALMEKENQETTKELLEGKYSAYTDLATTSLNSQARSCAIFVGLAEASLLDEVRDVDRYLALFRTTLDGKALGSVSYENVQLLVKGKVHLLSPVVPNTFPRIDVEQYYKTHYSHLTN